MVDFWHAEQKLKSATKKARTAKKVVGPAECGGRWGGPQEGYRSDQGHNLGKSCGQEARAGQELEELEGDLARRPVGGGSLRAFRRALTDDGFSVHLVSEMSPQRLQNDA